MNLPTRAAPAPKSHATLYVRHDHPLAKSKVGAKVSHTFTGHIREIAKDNDSGKRLRVHLEGVEMEGGHTDPEKKNAAGPLYCPHCGGRGKGAYCLNCGYKMVKTAKEMTEK